MGYVLFAAILVGLKTFVCAEESYGCSVDPNDECVFAGGVTECAFENKWFEEDYYWCNVQSGGWKKCKICEDDNSTSAEVTTETTTTTPVSTTTTNSAPTTTTATTLGATSATTTTTIPMTTTTATTTLGTSSTTTKTPMTTTTTTTTLGTSPTTTSTTAPPAPAYRCSVNPNNKCVFSDGASECKYSWHGYYWCNAQSNWEKCKICEDTNSTVEEAIASDSSKNSPAYKCSTNKNISCAFPFKYKGKTYNECTTYESRSGKPWCNTNNRRITWVYCEICEDPKSASSTTKPTTTRSTTTTEKPSSTTTTKRTSTTTDKTSTTTTKKASTTTPKKTSTTTPKKTSTTTVPKTVKPRERRPDKEKIPGPSQEGKNPDPSLGSKEKSTLEGSGNSGNGDGGKKSNTVMILVLVLCIAAAIIGIVVVVIFVRRRRNKPSSRGVEDGGSGDSLLLNANGSSSSKSMSPDGSQEMQPLTSKTEELENKPAAGDHIILHGGKDSRSEGEILS